MWLAEQWDNVQSFMKDMDISSCSASYLRKKIAQVNKPKADVQSQPKAEKTETASVGHPAVESPAVTEGNESPEITEGNKASISVETEQEFAEGMLEIARSQGLNIEKIIECLIQYA
jgi:hypothetical protein